MLPLAAGAFTIWTLLVAWMGFSLGRDCYAPLRDRKGRFAKRQ